MSTQPRWLSSRKMTIVEAAAAHKQIWMSLYTVQRKNGEKNAKQTMYFKKDETYTQINNQNCYHKQSESTERAADDLSSAVLLPSVSLIYIMTNCQLWWKHIRSCSWTRCRGFGELRQNCIDRSLCASAGLLEFGSVNHFLFSKCPKNEPLCARCGPKIHVGTWEADV